MAGGACSFRSSTRRARRSRSVWRSGDSRATEREPRSGEAVERREAEDAHENVVEVLAAAELDVLHAGRHRLGGLALAIGEQGDLRSLAGCIAHRADAIQGHGGHETDDARGVWVDV